MYTQNVRYLQTGLIHFSYTIVPCLRHSAAAAFIIISSCLVDSVLKKSIEKYKQFKNKLYFTTNVSHGCFYIKTFYIKVVQIFMEITLCFNHFFEKNCWITQFNLQFGKNCNICFVDKDEALTTSPSQQTSSVKFFFKNFKGLRYNFSNHFQSNS